MTNDTLIS